MKTSMLSLLGTVLVATSVSNAQCTFYPPPPTGLVASYYFNNNVVETISNSSTGNVIQNATFTTDRFGSSNSALQFGNTSSSTMASSEYVSLNNPGFFSGDFTIMYWFKTDSSQNNRRMYLFSIDSTGLSDNLNMELNDGNGYWTYWNGQGLPGYRGENLNQYLDDAWHLAALRRNGSNLDYFIDMNLKATQNVGSSLIGTNLNSHGGKINLGMDNGDYPGYPPGFFVSWGFNGKIDDLSLYNIALTDEVMKNYYTNYDLAAWFTFSGSLADSSGCNNTAIFSTSTSNSLDLPSLTTNHFGTANSAYHFNGNSIIKVDAFSNNPVTSCIDFFSNDFSISFWSRTGTNNKRQFAFSVDRSAGWPPSNNLAIEFNDSDLPSPGFWTYWNGEGAPGITEGAMNKYSDSLWHFVTLTRNASSGWLTAYIDADTVGTYLDTISATIGSNTDTMDIGHYRQAYAISVLGFDHGFVGDLDEFKFYRHTQSYSEISSAYADTRTAYRMVGINSLDKKGVGLSVYPNPFDSRFYIQANEDLGYIKVTDIMGKLITTKHTGGNFAELNLEQALPGVYFIAIYSQSQVLLANKKIIKK